MVFYRRFIRDSEGATAIEYGLIAALIAVAAIAAMGSVGGGVSAVFEKAGGKLTQAAADAPANGNSPPGGGSDPEE